MATTALVLAPDRIARHRYWDACFVSLSLAHAIVILLYPSILTIAIGLWWNANTIAHNFIHRPFFRRAGLRRAYSAYLTVLLGIPQSLWRRRHLLHHAGLDRRLRLTADVAIETALVLALWSVMAAVLPSFFLTVYLPGWALGLVLCQLHGHYEHAGGTTSHYGRVYNWLFFNDGFHVEHHLRPTAHWTELGHVRNGSERASRWPAVLRWIDAFGLHALERRVLRSPRLQRMVLDVHERAIRRLAADIGPVDRATVIGGGLFPRTTLILQRIYPSAEITIVDAVAAHLDIARPFVDAAPRLRSGAAVRFEQRAFVPGAPEPADLVVIPLSFDGDRRRVIAQPPARAVLVHDWIWRPAPRSVVVAWWLFKRITLVLRTGP